MVVDKFLGASDGEWLSRFTLDQKLIADYRQVLSENAQQSNSRSIFLERQDSCPKIRVPQSGRVNIHFQTGVKASRNDLDRLVCGSVANR